MRYFWVRMRYCSKNWLMECFFSFFFLLTFLCLDISRSFSPEGDSFFFSPTGCPKLIPILKVEAWFSGLPPTSDDLQFVFISPGCFRRSSEGSSGACFSGFSRLIFFCPFVLIIVFCFYFKVSSAHFLLFVRHLFFYYWV